MSSLNIAKHCEIDNWKKCCLLMLKVSLLGVAAYSEHEKVNSYTSCHKSCLVKPGALLFTSAQLMLIDGRVINAYNDCASNV